MSDDIFKEVRFDLYCTVLSVRKKKQKKQTILATNVLLNR